MKQIFLILLFAYATISFSQKNEGIATYEVTNKLEIKGIEGLNIDLPDETKGLRKLKFKDSTSVFEVIQKEKDITKTSGVFFNFIEPDNKLYIDRKSKETIEKKDFMGKQFLIESKHSSIKWHKTSEVKKIGDYFCQLATFRDTSKTLHAWFTPQIPNGFGPDKYGDLPGLIVLLIENEGKVIYNLKEIEFKTIDKIKPPKKGKKVTKDEYDKIVEEKMKNRGGVFEFYQED